MVSNNKMNLQLVDNEFDEKLNYYAKDNVNIVGENYSCLGFKDDRPVLSGHFNASQIKCQFKIIRKIPQRVTLSKAEQNIGGNKFINLNGQRLKVVPQGQIPEEILRRQLLLKKNSMVKPNNSKSPPSLHVLGSAGDVNNKASVQLAKTKADNVLHDKPGMKKMKLITTKLYAKPSSIIHSSRYNSQCIHRNGIKPAKTVSVIPSRTKELVPHSLTLHSEDDLSSDCEIVDFVDKEVISFPGPADLKKNCIHLDNNLQPDSESCHVVEQPKRHFKLLCERTLLVLNQVKMQALNLSKKKSSEKIVRDVGIQADLSYMNKISTEVQTDAQPNRYFDLLDYMDINAMIESSLGESPMINDVNMGVTPLINFSMKANNFSDHIDQVGAGSMGHYSSAKQLVDESNDIQMKKKLLFFKDLRECLIYNPSGNLPIHEGVINCDIGLVKRNCAALMARNAGVNVENHNGCTPLQLAIIHDAHVDIVQSLLDAGVDIREQDGDGNNILHLGAKFARLKILEVIMYHKSFSAFRDCLNAVNFEGLNPLMICCMASWTEGAALFIKHRADVNAKDQTSGRTALFHAAEVQNVDIVGNLLNHGADPKIKNFFGTSPHDAMYELEEMPHSIKSLIFGKSKKRTIEAEMNPTRTAKAAKKLKTFSRLQKIEPKSSEVLPLPMRFKMPQIK